MTKSILEKNGALDVNTRWAGLHSFTVSKNETDRKRQKKTRNQPNDGVLFAVVGGLSREDSSVLPRDVSRGGLSLYHPNNFVSTKQRHN